MPVYESEELPRDKLEELRRKSSCKECGGWVNMFLDPESGKAFIACNDWLRTHHDGIVKEAKYFEENIITRRERMEKELGQEKALALADAANIAVMTKPVAIQIIETLWGDAPTIDKTKAIMMCYQYNLNPLMKHLHMVGYRKRDEDGKFIKDKSGQNVKDWTIIVGIQATRLMSHRKHKFTYLDMSPRIATQEEIEKILGETARDDMVYGFTHIKDLETGAESFGLKGWPTKDKAKGEEKGNTQLNMACVRSERQAIDKLYPSELPDADVMDEQFIEVENGGVVDVSTGEINPFEPLDQESVRQAKLKAETAVADEPEPPRDPDNTGDSISDEEQDITEEQALPVSEEQVASLKELMSKAGMTPTEVGAFCNNEKHGNCWNIRELKDLKVWQYELVVDHIKVSKAVS